MTYAILFPGQGSQEVGMGGDLFDARPDLLVETADEVLGWSLRDVCLGGPIEALTATDRAQPALYALATALWMELSAAIDGAGLPAPSAAAGHSLGEFSALTAAGALDFADGLRLVATRGAAMAAAAATEASAMAALLGADDELAERVASERRAAGGRLWVANLNAPGQVVVAGSVEDIDWLVDNGRELGVRRAIKLNVAGAFHSPYMQPAVADVAAALGQVTFAELEFPVWSNVTAQPVARDEIAELGARQVVSPVRFSASLAAMHGAGATAFIHVGPGDVTAGMAKRAAPGAEVIVVNELASLDDAVRALSEAIQ
jgi:[acyl-carrier-protein] S-malonyltransferase